MNLKIILTEDGSHSLFSEDFNETYHSFHGAVQESNHVFLKEGLSFLEERDEIRVFEVGFGTGLNALLSACWASKENKKIVYDSVEAYPVGKEIIDKLNYPGIIDCSQSIEWFKALHQASWDQLHELNHYFKFRKIQSKLQAVSFEKKYDIIFFDAFAPNKQADMWELNIIQNMFNLLNAGGVLVTYCAKGQFKRDLNTAGFQVASLSGPPGKKEMVRALKPGK